jgi:hypothetical protein
MNPLSYELYTTCAKIQKLGRTCCQGYHYSSVQSSSPYAILEDMLSQDYLHPISSIYIKSIICEKSALDSSEGWFLPLLCSKLIHSILDCDEIARHLALRYVKEYILDSIYLLSHDPQLRILLHLSDITAMQTLVRSTINHHASAAVHISPSDMDSLVNTLLSAFLASINDNLTLAPNVIFIEVPGYSPGESHVHTNALLMVIRSILLNNIHHHVLTHTSLTLNLFSEIF